MQACNAHFDHCAPLKTFVALWVFVTVIPLWLLNKVWIFKRSAFCDCRKTRCKKICSDMNDRCICVQDVWNVALISVVRLLVSAFLWDNYKLYVDKSVYIKYVSLTNPKTKYPLHYLVVFSVFFFAVPNSEEAEAKRPQIK